MHHFVGHCPVPSVATIVAIEDGGAPWTPADVTSANLICWFEMDDVNTSGSAITRFNDKSGAGRHATPVGVNNRPTLIASDANFNSQPTADFISTGSYSTSDHANFATNAWTGVTAAEMWWIGKLDSAAPTVGNEGFCHFGSPAAAELFPYTLDGKIYDNFGSNAAKGGGLVATNLDQKWYYRAISTSSEWTHFLKTTQLFTTATNTVAFSSATYIGTSVPGAKFYDGQMACLCIFDGKLSAGDVALMTTYITDKFGAF